MSNKVMNEKSRELTTKLLDSIAKLTIDFCGEHNDNHPDDELIMVCIMASATFTTASMMAAGMKKDKIKEFYSTFVDEIEFNKN